MEVVEYKRSLQWVGDLQCPSCNGLNAAWRSSGMSDCYPHFYCDTCSNVIQRDADKKILLDEKASEETLRKIASTLPKCTCGGQFAPSCGPKCRHCNAEIPIVRDKLEYLYNPNMVVVDGACTFSDVREPYRVKIIEEQSSTINRPKNDSTSGWLCKVAKLLGFR